MDQTAKGRSIHALTKALAREFELTDLGNGVHNTEYEDWRDNRAIPLLKRLNRAGWRLTRIPKKSPR